MSITLLSKMSIRISIIITLCLTTSCDTEKDLLHSYRNAGLKIRFDPSGENPNRRKDLVRNGIPVPIRVMLYSAKFDTQDVTEKVKDNWQYLDPKLGKVLYDSTMSAYVYLYDGIDTGVQKIKVTLEAYSDSINFEVSPVEFVEVDGDTFMMGSNSGEAQSDEKPVHHVYVDDFKIGKFEVTNTEYKVFLEKNFHPLEGPIIYSIESGDREGFHLKDSMKLILGVRKSLIEYIDNKVKIVPGFEDHPVTGVTWLGALKYAEYYNLRLPTEAEWEYACKGITNDDYPEGDKASLLDYAVFFDNCSDCDTPDRVGTKKENMFKLFDIYGNAMEWCSDFYDSNFYKNRPHPDINPTGPNDTLGILYQKVVRGGGFRSYSYNCRSSKRDWKEDNSFYEFLGFRVVRNYP